MRRLLAIILVAGPLVAGAQTAATITFDGSSTSPTIIKAQCNGAQAADTISLAWMIQMISGNSFPLGGGGEYRVFAATSDPGNTTPYCYTPGTTGQTVGKVTTTPTTPAVTSTSSSATVTTSDLASKAGYDCTVDKTITVCVAWYPTSGSADSSFQGYAKGQVNLKVVPPDAPVVDTVQPGGKSLTIWVKTPATTTSTVAASTFRARAVGPDSVEHLSDPVAAAGTTPVRARIDGLVDGVLYTVTAFAYSAEGNQSVLSDCYRLPIGAATCTTVAPRPVQDAWEFYKAADGRDSGGCDAGPAGMVALLGAVTLLRIRRRA
jgi:hypothetical protein